MQAASRIREDGMENPAGGMLGGARGLATITTSRVEIPRPDPGRHGGSGPPGTGRCRQIPMPV